HCRGRAGGRALEDSHNNSIPWCAVLNRGTEPVLRTVVQGQRGQPAFGGGQLPSPTVGHRHNHRYDGRVWLGSRERAEHHGDKNERDTSPSHTSLLFPLRQQPSWTLACRAYHYAASVTSPPWSLRRRSHLVDLTGEPTGAGAPSPCRFAIAACSRTSLTPSVGRPLPVAHPCVVRPHSKHSRYRRSGVRRIQSSWPMNQHFNDSRRNCNAACGMWVHTAAATAKTVVFSTRERTTTGLLHLTNQIKPAVPSTMTPRRVSKRSYCQPGERSR